MSNVQYALMAGFRAVNAWQQALVRNAQGLVLPGYNRIDIKLGGTPSGEQTSSSIATNNQGSTGTLGGGGDTLSITGSQITFQQGELQPTQSATSLAIKGDGFFLLAENLRPGARLLLSRNGDFHYDAQGRLVNSQGLFVIGGGGALTDPPTPVTNPGNGTVNLTQLTLARVGAASQLAVSGYGPLIYQATAASGNIQPFQNGRPEVGFVQDFSLEYQQRAGQLSNLTVENTYAQQTYKMFKDLLDNYNKAQDDAIGTVK